MNSNTKFLKATAVSPANIAFIKYWGKRNPKINLPYNNSISMNLSNCITTTTVEYLSNLKSDKITINGKKAEGEQAKRVSDFLGMIRKRYKVKLHAKVVSENNFPTKAGIASSAAGFSALALAATAAAGLKLKTKELSILARIGSGSASRSVIDGFAEWRAGTNSKNSYSYKIADVDHWDILDIVAVVAKEKKKVGSTQGHAAVLTSPYYQARQKELPKRLKDLKKALLAKDFKNFGKLLEEEAVSLHVIATTSKPPVYYWNRVTIDIMKKLIDWREEGVYAYFTMDAGPNVHVICRQKDAKKVNSRLKKIDGVLFTIVNTPAVGTRLSDIHLF